MLGIGLDPCTFLEPGASDEERLESGRRQQGAQDCAVRVREHLAQDVRAERAEEGLTGPEDRVLGPLDVDLDHDAIPLGDHVGDRIE
jgi:hypothetical protein